MNRKVRVIQGGLAVLAMTLVACGTDDADLILTNANIYTLAWDDPDREGNPAADAPFDDGFWTADAEAVALKDGLIVAVGSAADVETFRGPNTQVLDMAGATVVPGLIESHGHYEELGELAEEVDLIGRSPR